MSDEKELQVQDPDVILAKVVLQGDLSSLKPREKVQYYNSLCHALGLNPLTRPFDYMTLNGKVVLYANKSCTEQLRKRDGVSVVEKTESRINDVFIITVKVRDKNGREDIGSGAITMDESMKGDTLANTYMKCETKAKRRATLSICGLGMIDETEIDTTEAQFVTDDELNKARSAIYQLFEDNEGYIEENYKSTTLMDVDFAVSERDISGLETIYTEVKAEIRKAKNPEIKDATDKSAEEAASILAKGGFKKASEIADREEIDATSNDEPDIPEADQKELEIF